MLKLRLCKWSPFGGWREYIYIHMPAAWGCLRYVLSNSESTCFTVTLGISLKRCMLMLIQASGTFTIAYPSIQLEDQGTPWKYLHIFPYYLNIFTYIIIYLHTEPLNHCILYILHMVPCIANRRHPSKKTCSVGNVFLRNTISKTITWTIQHYNTMSCSGGKFSAKTSLNNNCQLLSHSRPFIVSHDFPKRVYPHFHRPRFHFSAALIQRLGLKGILGPERRSFGGDCIMGYCH